MSLFLRAAGATDLGLVRTNNEDSLHVGRWVLAVADGMGGLPAGELASEMITVELAALDRSLGSCPDGAGPAPEGAGSAGPADLAAERAAVAGRVEPGAEGAGPAVPGRGPDVDPTAVLRSSVSEANRRIREAAESEPAHQGMGSTVTALLLAGDRIALLHVGDSRCYLLRQGTLRQLTRDDTFVQSLVDRGVLTAEGARAHPQRSLVTKAVQGFDFAPAESLLTARVGDRFLLCSDGLSDVVADDAISHALTSYAEPGQCAEGLVKLAVQAGAPDNVSAIVADVRDG
jgi:serine/threonine protein phosphatase PrpC